MLRGIRRASNILFRRFFKMEVDSEDITYSYEHLTSVLLEKGPGNESAAIKEYLKNLPYPPVKDFKAGLEWFNVAEPLSFHKHLKGKVVILDFFTYCCINCMHIIPDLKEIETEFSIEDGVVVIGVHSAKFDNEKVSANILAAVQRYNISHPVVNDMDSEMWQSCGVHCWPTLLMLGPEANPIVMLMGEGHKENLRLFIKYALEYYKSKNLLSDHKLPLKSAYHLLPSLKGPLLFPGKITSYFDKGSGKEYLAISDTGNHRILLVNSDGMLVEQIGGNGAGFRDGGLDEAKFNSPQGLAFLNKDMIFVADTENHAIRTIDLKKRCVQTVAGTGQQGCDRIGGKPGLLQPISSPWDVCIYTTPDMDMSFHASAEETPFKDVVIIAMAGTHQIWAFFTQDTIWWKFKKYAAGTCVCIAGSGREENRNNQYPHAAAFAQPSGLALHVGNKELYVADSESSSVRRLSLTDGKVTGVVGGDRNPNNLFAFGDKDGVFCEAKLQHVLGLAISDTENALYVADTYNHKLKKVDIIKNSITTLNGIEPGKFREPGGLCVSADGKRLYVADTNNHTIRVVELDRHFLVRRIRDLELAIDAARTSRNRAKHEMLKGKAMAVSTKGGKLIVKLEMKLENLGLTKDAEQKWSVDLPSAAWNCVPSAGSNVMDVDVVVSVPPMKDQGDSGVVEFVFNLLTCDNDVCMPKNFVVQLPVVYEQDGAVEGNGFVQVGLKPSCVVLI